MFASRQHGERMFTIVLFSALALFVESLPTIAGDVTYYDHPPSVDELQQKLISSQKKVKTRAIVFDEINAASKQSALAYQPATKINQPETTVLTSAPSTLQSTYVVSAYSSVPQVVTSRQSEHNIGTAVAFPIQFRINSSEIMPEAIPFLDSIAGLMQQNPSLRLIVEGHTDISGSYQYNLDLSRERAMAVVNYLTNHYGIAQARFMPIGRGPLDLLPGLEPTDPKNRRVQFRVDG